MIETRCGLKCDGCEYKTTCSCGGCIETNGHPFHGECPVAQCCQSKGFMHCGECPDIPCELLSQYSCDPIHGDKPAGARIEQCKQWAREELTKKESINNRNVFITTEFTKEHKDFVCKNLFEYNVRETNSVLKKPGININLFLKDEKKVIGAILCDTFNKCLYIDVMWIDEKYRGFGYGKKLISQAETIAKENGCLFSHTCTFSYQAPEFYKACGYTVFGELDEYPDGIIQYFLKKKL